MFEFIFNTSFAVFVSRKFVDPQERALFYDFPVNAHFQAKGSTPTDFFHLDSRTRAFNILLNKFSYFCALEDEDQDMGIGMGATKWADDFLPG